MTNIFSLSRLFKLIRKDLLSEYKSLAIWLSSAAGVMIVISALNILIYKLNGTDLNGSQFHFVFYILLLFPGGYILSASMFKDVHDKVRNIYWLTLPGSTLEKMVSRLLISSLFYAILLTLLYPLLALLSESFNLLLFGIRHSWFNPFNRAILKLIPYYIVTQSIFFAGAATFRKHPFAKTLLSLTLFQIALSILSALLARLILGNLFHSISNFQFSDGDLMRYTGSTISSITGTGKILVVAAKVFFWGILAPFFYVFAYFKLAEKEVRDGI
ncbi:MAG: hypothetical protein JXR86_17330 [Spirochaetales bacterium]|nr:hypothetical protein [Spirochaetales bacterium]